MSEASSRWRELAEQYAISVVPDEEPGVFVARAADFPDAIGAGRSRDEAAEELIRGIASMLEHADAVGVAAPPPMRRYTGSVSVRLPRSLHLALSQRAEAEGLSLNATITYLLTQSLGLEGHLPRPRRRPSSPAAPAD